MPTPLAPDALAQALAELPAWEVRAGKLHRDLTFADFAQAFAFMTRVARVADEMGHHPEWFNVWNRVRIDLVTHDVGAISELDVALAKRIDALAQGS